MDLKLHFYSIKIWHNLSYYFGQISLWYICMLSSKICIVESSSWDQLISLDQSRSLWLILGCLTWSEWPLINSFFLLLSQAWNEGLRLGWNVVFQMLWWLTFVGYRLSILWWRNFRGFRHVSWNSRFGGLLSLNNSLWRTRSSIDWRFGLNLV